MCVAGLEEGLGFPFLAEWEEAALEANKQQKREKSSAGLYVMGFCCLEKEETLL